MKRTITRLLAGLLAAGLLLSGCGQDSIPSGAEPGAPRGRYVETALTLPEGVDVIVAADQMDDGSIQIFGFQVDEQFLAGASGAYRVWNSGDNGATWQEKDLPWYGELDEVIAVHNGNVDQAAFISPDELYLGIFEYIEEAPEIPAETPGETKEETTAGEDETTAVEEEAAAGDEGDEVVVKSFSTGGTIISTLYRATADGLESLGHSLMSDLGEGSTTPDLMHVIGDSLLLSYPRYAKLMDVKTGEEMLRFPSDAQVMHGSFANTEDTLYLSQTSGFFAYDLATGDKLPDLPLTNLETLEDDPFSYSGTPANLTAVALTGDGAAAFYANATGIYRMPLDGSVTEKLMDGDLNTIGLPSVYVTHLFQCLDESFLVFATDGRQGPLLFRYSFDPALPSAPGSELSVYSLYESQTIRQAITQMQLNNKDVKVNYRVGMADANAVTAADALRTLSTEILAGSGPDVMVLDGIPVDSYIEKGVLSDLSGLLDEKINAGEIIPGIANAFRREEKLYAVPARFSVPMLHGADIGSIAGLDSLAGWLGAKGAEDIGLDGSLILEHFYDMLAPGWFLPDGGLDEARFASDLEALRAIAAQPDGDATPYSHMVSLSSGAVAFKGGYLPLNLSTAMGITDVAGPYSVIAESGEGEVKLFPGDGLFIPGTVLGVNAASPKAGLAGQFIETALSGAVQTQDFMDGMPVNDAALTAQAADERKFNMAFGTTIQSDDGGEDDFIYLEITRPSDEIMNNVLDSFRALTVPSFADAVVKDMVLEEGTPYTKGERSLEDTLAALQGKLGLYLAE